MPKFFIKSENLKENNEIWITGNDINHIKNVLRKKVDDLLNICNSDTSKNYEAKILKCIKENVIIGKLIPAGTGMQKYQNIHINTEKELEQVADTENME